MAQKTNRTKIREAIARAMNLKDDDARVLQAADEIIATFPQLREVDPITYTLDFARSKSPAAQLSLEIESALKIQFGWDATGTKGGMEFVNHAVKRTQAGEHYQVFLDWLKVQGGLKYWSFPRMRERYGEAFIRQEKPEIQAIPQVDESQFVPMRGRNV